MIISSGRKPWRLWPLLCCAALMLGLFPTPARADDPYNLICDVTGPWGDQRHTIRVEDSWKHLLAPNFASPTMRLLEQGSHDFTVVTFDADKISAVLDGRLYGWPDKATRASYDLDRNTGAVSISYLMSVGIKDVTVDGRAVQQISETLWLPKASEVGHCVKAPLAF